MTCQSILLDDLTAPLLTVLVAIVAVGKWSVFGSRKN